MSDTNENLYSTAAGGEAVESLEELAAKLLRHQIGPDPGYVDALEYTQNATLLHIAHSLRILVTATVTDPPELRATPTATPAEKPAASDPTDPHRELCECLADSGVEPTFTNFVMGQIDDGWTPDEIAVAVAREMRHEYTTRIVQIFQELRQAPGSSEFTPPELAAHYSAYRQGWNDRADTLQAVLMKLCPFTGGPKPEPPAPPRVPLAAGTVIDFQP